MQPMSCECFEDCNQGWNYHIHESLLPFLTEGKGVPQPDTPSVL